jgi:hypothetical protein
MDRSPEATVRSDVKVRRPLIPVDFCEDLDELIGVPDEKAPASIAERMENWGSD